jgi:hypothetical protein
MAGPLVYVDTISAGIPLELDRILRLGKDAVLEFLTPDRNAVDGWKVELTVARNFSRVSYDERVDGDGSDVIYGVADVQGVVGPIIALKDLHVRCLGDVHKVARVPPIAPNKAKVYRIVCGERTKRTTFDTTKGK